MTQALKQLHPTKISPEVRVRRYLINLSYEAFKHPTRIVPLAELVMMVGAPSITHLHSASRADSRLPPSSNSPVGKCEFYLRNALRDGTFQLHAAPCTSGGSWTAIFIAARKW